VFPFQALDFRDQVVVLSTDHCGSTCGGCPAEITTSVLRKRGTELEFVSRQARVVTAHGGGWGNPPTEVRPLKLGRDDAAVIEGGIAKGGYLYVAIHVIGFRGARATRLTSNNGIPLTYDDCDAAPPWGCLQVEGTWRADRDGRVVLHYTGRDRKRRKIDQDVVYRLHRGRLTLTSGRTPRSLVKAFGHR
jgi:hypothetical protein